MTNILIISDPRHPHANAVAWGLRQKGAHVTLWNSRAFPTRACETVRFGRGGREIQIGSGEEGVRDACPDVVWDHRPALAPDRELLDDEDRMFADGECRAFRQGLRHLVAKEAFWVNPRAGAERATLKIVQHETALRVGLDLPATVYSNDPGEIRGFLREQGGQLVYKTYGAGASWDAGRRVTCASIITEAHLADEDIIRCVPGIYQEVVPKRHELRITIMGDRAFVARLASQETARGHVDFRRAYGELGVTPDEAPAALIAQCRALMRDLGIVFGCFDFIVTPDGRYVFLEVNPMGQFLWVEHACGVPLLDAFCEFLIQATPSFAWTPSRATVSLPRYRAARNARSCREPTARYVSP